MWMKNKGVPTGVALLVIIFVLIIASVLFGAIIGSSISGFTKDLPEYQQKLSAETTMLFNKLESFGLSIDLQQIRESFQPAKVFGLVGTTLASFGNMMTNFLLILLTVTFILAEEVSFANKLAANTISAKAQAAIQQFTAAVNSYVAIKTSVSVLTGFLIMLWLWIIGLDYFILWGLIAFLLNFIPTFGSILAAIPAVLLAIIQLGVGDALLVAVGFVTVNFVVGNIIEPRLMGRGLDLSVLVVFLSLVFWGWVLGPVGMLLSIPLTMTLKIAFENFDETRWLAVMMGSGKSTQAAKTEDALALPNSEE